MIDDFLDEIYFRQTELQKNFINERQIPSTVEMYNAATAMMVEIGEMLQADKRWKQSVHHMNRPIPYNKEEFLKEYADVFIYLMNVGIYEGLTMDEIKTAIVKKMKINYNRFASSGMLKEVVND